MEQDLLNLINVDFRRAWAREVMDLLLVDSLPTFQTFVSYHPMSESLTDSQAKHLKEIFKAIIYSKECWVQSGSIRTYCMSGFLQRTGRLPTDKDCIKLIRGHSFLSVREHLSEQQREIRSEVNFYIIHIE